MLIPLPQYSGEWVVMVVHQNKLDAHSTIIEFYGLPPVKDYGADALARAVHPMVAPKSPLHETMFIVGHLSIIGHSPQFQLCIKPVTNSFATATTLFAPLELMVSNYPVTAEGLHVHKPFVEACQSQYGFMQTEPILTRLFDYFKTNLQL